MSLSSKKAAARPGSFAAAVQGLRQRLDWTQEAMARKLGCSLAAYRRWESGERAPSARWMIRLLALCPDEQTRGLFGLTGETMKSDLMAGTGPSPLTGKQRTEMREEVHTVIDLLFDRAPDPIVNDLVRRLREYGGRYGRPRPDPK